MNALLDTHTFLWWVFDDPRLSKAAHHVIRDPDNTLFVSAASGWEISTKFRLGKLAHAKALVGNVQSCMEKAGFVEMPVTLAHGELAGSYVVAHRDPFDRMLAAQSSLEELPLVSADPAFALFGVKVIW